METSGIARLGLGSTFYVDQAAYFLAQNPTPGTGFAQNIQTSYSATKPFITIFNSAAALVSGSGPGNQVGNARAIYLDYIRLICSAAGSTTTSGHVVAAIDNGNRYSSGTASTPTPVNLYIGGPASKATIQVGPITATAATSAAILLGRSVLRVAAAPAWIVFDEVILHFSDEGTNEAQSVTATTASRIDVWMPPVVIYPQQTFLLAPYNVANATTAPSFEYEIGYWER